MQNILNLSRYNVLTSNETDHDYHVEAETADPAVICRSCGSEDVLGGGRQEILIKDLPMHGKRVGIYVKARRFRCRDCGKTHTELLPDVIDGQRMTVRLYHWICQQSVCRTFTSIAHDVGVSEGTVRGIFNEYVAQLERKFEFITPEWMGLDEIHIIKKPRCVITNIESNTVVNILPERTKAVVFNHLMRMKNRKTIKCVAMDMWQPYRDAVYGAVDGVSIVIDKFHVLRMANQSLDTIRKSIRDGLTTKQRRGLMHDRFILLKREPELQPIERITLESWTRNFPALGEAYAAKERFFDFYEAMSVSEAEMAYRRWEDGLHDSIRDAYKPLTTAMTNWRTEIMNYFEHPVTNAFTECVNGLIRVVNRCGRGYSFAALRAKILFSSGAHKVVRPKFQRQSTDMFERFTAFSYGLPTSEQPETKNYGIDVSTLERLLDAGKL